MPIKRYRATDRERQPVSMLTIEKNYFKETLKLVAKLPFVYPLKK